MNIPLRGAKAQKTAAMTAVPSWLGSGNFPHAPIRTADRVVKKNELRWTMGKIYEGTNGASRKKQRV
jgi:hypothetical protein